jgi:hypothetical protein
MDTDVRFELDIAALGRPTAVRLRRFGARWVAQLAGGELPLAVGPSARAALVGVLEPLGRDAVTRALADVALLEPSLEVLRLEGAAPA